MSKVADLAYDIEQLFIEGYSPKTIASLLECPLETVYAWLEELSISDDDAEFGPLYDAYQRERIKGYFINDAWAHGVDWAAEHYRKYNCWKESWIEDARKELGE